VGVRIDLPTQRAPQPTETVVSAVDMERLGMGPRRLEIRYLTDGDGSLLAMWERHAVLFQLEGPDDEILVIRARPHGDGPADWADRLPRRQRMETIRGGFCKAYVGDPTERGQLPIYAEMQVPLISGAHDALLVELIDCAAAVAVASSTGSTTRAVCCSQLTGNIPSGRGIRARAGWCPTRPRVPRWSPGTPARRPRGPGRVPGQRPAAGRIDRADAGRDTAPGPADLFPVRIVQPQLVPADVDRDPVQATANSELPPVWLTQVGRCGPGRRFRTGRRCRTSAAPRSACGAHDHQ